MHLAQFSTSQLAELRGQLRMNIATLEHLAQFRSVEDNQSLADQRALMRRVTRELKKRITQLPLF